MGELVPQSPPLPFLTPLSTSSTATIARNSSFGKMVSKILAMTSTGPGWLFFIFLNRFRFFIFPYPPCALRRPIYDCSKASPILCFMGWPLWFCSWDDFCLINHQPTLPLSKERSNPVAVVSRRLRSSRVKPHDFNFVKVIFIYSCYLYFCSLIIVSGGLIPIPTIRVNP